ncbi:hypothetical protein EVG20_g5601 [Dentipellis fragilis]|uniref:F-box domain-containing protein n=1 Tax=Dentipellis fragilis TaxID=205917 RepID=A0A4Y9YUL1_9AGAM|nr:hypothetical protein EVG20_g5601 [Dentipellis fragilis]
MSARAIPTADLWYSRYTLSSNMIRSTAIDLKISAITSNTAEQHNEVYPPDPNMHFIENDSKDVASRASARKHFELEMTSRINIMYPNLPWTAPGDVHTLITSMSSGDAAVATLMDFVTRYNALAPIHILPVEILCSIFFYIVHDPRRRPARANRRLMCTSAVCNFWRRIILSHPRLWTRINILSSEHASLALERSQNVPIDVNLVCDDSRHAPPNWKPVLDHAARIATLTCSATSSILDSLLGGFPSSLPLMHTLLLKNPDINYEPEFRGTYLFRGTSIARTSMPALRKLTLEGVSLPWTLPLFRGLSYLHVQLDGVPFFFEFQTFCDVIMACPQLETLRLHNVGPDPTDADSVVLPTPISLPKLHHLELYCLAPQAFGCTTRVLSTISTIQPTAIVSITCFVSDESGLSYSSSGSDLGQLCITHDMNSYMPRLLGRLPPVCTAIYHPNSAHPTQEILNDLRAVLAELNVRQLETLVLDSVPLKVAVEALSSRDAGVLKELKMQNVPRDGTEEEMDGYLEILKRLVADVEVHFAYVWRTTSMN